MNSQKFNFLPKRSIFSRQRMYFVGGFLFLAAVAAAGGLYLRENRSDSVAMAEVKGAVDSRILPKEWLVKYFLTDDIDAVAVNGPDGDPDGDTLSNYQEYLFGTDPTKDDTDGDGYIDGYELAFNLDPLGPGSLSADVENSYVKEFLVSNEQYQDLAQDKILGQFEQLLQPDRAVVMDFPDDRELTITSDNSTEAFEKYFNETESITSADQAELEDITNNLFAFSVEQLEQYIQKLQAKETLLKAVPVPSELANIQRVKIAGVRAGRRIFEIVLDENLYGSNSQFWPDIFYQTSIVQNAGQVEVALWHEVGLVLQDRGGLPE